MVIAFSGSLHVKVTMTGALYQPAPLGGRSADALIVGPAPTDRTSGSESDSLLLVTVTARKPTIARLSMRRRAVNAVGLETVTTSTVVPLPKLTWVAASKCV